MNTFIRISLVTAALSAAVASQALTLRYIGSTDGVAQTTGFTTVSTGQLSNDEFGFGASKTLAATPTTGTIRLYNTLVDLQSNDGDYLLLNYTLDTPAGQAVTATATATGFGSYGNLAGTGIRVARLNVVGYDILIQGTVNAVPEPASMAALGLGAVALLRRRRA